MVSKMGYRTLGVVAAFFITLSLGGCASTGQALKSEDGFILGITSVWADNSSSVREFLKKPAIALYWFGFSSGQSVQTYPYQPDQNGKCELSVPAYDPRNGVTWVISAMFGGGEDTGDTLGYFSWGMIFLADDSNGDGAIDPRALDPDYEGEDRLAGIANNSLVVYVSDQQVLNTFEKRNKQLVEEGKPWSCYVGLKVGYNLCEGVRCPENTDRCGFDGFKRIEGTAVLNITDMPWSLSIPNWT